MPTESLILRRCYPVPVTFADLRAAYCSHRNHGLATMYEMLYADLKEDLGAIDEVYAVIDGQEVRVATVTGSGETATANMFGPISAGQAAEILIAADEAGYWERPHEVRVVFQERMMSRAAVERAVNVGWTARGGSA